MNENALSPAQQDAAKQAWGAAADVLEAGAQGAETVLLAELTHAVHSCRVAGLHRLSSAGLRVAQHVRDLHVHRPEFRLAALTRDFQDMLATAHALRSAQKPLQEWIGQARRAYTPLGTLDLVGLFTEPVVSAAGFAGVVTYLVDKEQLVWSLGDVAPGGADRCRWSYVTPLELGGVSLEHRTLCRGGIHLAHATAAANRRLGTGQRIKAELSESAGWSDPSVARLWGTPLEVQLDRAWRTRSEDGRAGDDLLFTRGSVIGVHEDALTLQIGSRQLRGVAPSAHKQLGYRRNLRALSGSPGRELMLIGRIAFSQPGTLFLLAVKPVDGDDIVNLGLDSLPSTRLRAKAAAERRSQDVVDPLEPLTRRLRQVLLGGRATLKHGALKAFAADEELLARRQMPTAAQLLRELRAPTDRSGLAHAWLRARTYLVAASARLQRLEWLDS